MRATLTTWTINTLAAATEACPDSQLLTAAEVVARCAEAMGGDDRIAAVKPRRLTVDSPGYKVPCVVEIKRPTRIRGEVHHVLVLDDKRCEMPGSAIGP